MMCYVNCVCICKVEYDQQQTKKKEERCLMNLCKTNFIKIHRFDSKRTGPYLNERIKSQ